MRPHTLGSLALTLVLASCSASDDGAEANPFTRATPDVAGLTIETSFRDGRVSCGQLDGMCDLGAAAAEVNASLRAVLEQVEAAAAAPWEQRSGPGGAETAGSFVQHGPVDVPAGKPVVSFHLSGREPRRWSVPVASRRARLRDDDARGDHRRGPRGGG